MATQNNNSEAVPTTCDAIFWNRRNDDKVALKFEDQSWTYRQWIQASQVRAALFERWAQAGPTHIGILLDNVPDFCFWTTACLITGNTMVGLNSTRAASAIETDIAHTDCQMVITESRYLDLVKGSSLYKQGRVLVVDSEQYAKELSKHETAPWPSTQAQPEDIAFLIFTSGSTGAPKACVRRQKTVAPTAAFSHLVTGNTASDVLYCAMPLFHSNSLFMSFLAAVGIGATLVLKRKFSASEFLPDVRRYGVTFFNYVGRPLSYILATPPKDNDTDNSLRMAFGAEASDIDIDRFSQRFGCEVKDTYGTTEGVVACMREPDMPTCALGRLPPGHQVVSPNTNAVCAAAEFNQHGQLLNANEAIGEIVRVDADALFEGYYKNDQANQNKLRDGWYWSGDLGYVDSLGWLYFSGRDDNWLRVDGENLAVAPIEQAIAQLEGVASAAAYAVPAVDAGDELMVAIELQASGIFDPYSFAAALKNRGLGKKSIPKYIRLIENMPTTATAKIQRNLLRKEGWQTEDTVWWIPGRENRYREIQENDKKEIRKAMVERGRDNLLQTIN